MSRMRPRQEAEYALAYGGVNTLSPEGKTEYDRLLAERPQREEPSVIDVEAQNRKALRDAETAIADGRKVFIARIPMNMGKFIVVGTAGLPQASSLVEAIENLGWRLDQMQVVMREFNAPEGFFLFRNDAG